MNCVSCCMQDSVLHAAAVTPMLHRHLHSHLLLHKCFIMTLHKCFIMTPAHYKLPSLPHSCTGPSFKTIISYCHNKVNSSIQIMLCIMLLHVMHCHLHSHLLICERFIMTPAPCFKICKLPSLPLPCTGPGYNFLLPQQSEQCYTSHACPRHTIQAVTK